VTAIMFHHRAGNISGIDADTGHQISRSFLVVFDGHFLRHPGQTGVEWEISCGIERIYAVIFPRIGNMGREYL